MSASSTGHTSRIPHLPVGARRGYPRPFLVVRASGDSRADREGSRWAGSVVPRAAVSAHRRDPMWGERGGLGSQCGGGVVPAGALWAADLKVASTGTGAWSSSCCCPRIERRSLFTSSSDRTRARAPSSRDAHVPHPPRDNGPVHRGMTLREQRKRLGARSELSPADRRG